MNDWVQIKGFGECYFINKNGKIKSIDKKISHWRGGSRIIKGRLLRPTNRKGYYFVNLSDNGILKMKAIHRLVIENFTSNPKNKSQVNHKNGIKTDNRVENLEWVTPSENTKHAYDIGLIKKRYGQNWHTTKLSNSKIKKIRTIYKKGKITMQKLAIKFNTTASNICLIVNNKSRINE